VVVPAEAVQVGQEGQHVFVIKPDNSVEVRPVVVARTNEGEAVIAQGLQPGEQIVREGQFLLGPGSRVEIKDGRPTEVGEQKREIGEEKREKGERRKSKAQERSAS
jgi:multidrug efflux system membrane fusion protein